MAPKRKVASTKKKSKPSSEELYEISKEKWDIIEEQDKVAIPLTYKGHYKQHDRRKLMDKFIDDKADDLFPTVVGTHQGPKNETQKQVKGQALIRLMNQVKKKGIKLYKFNCNSKEWEEVTDQNEVEDIVAKWVKRRKERMEDQKRKAAKRAAASASASTSTTTMENNWNNGNNPKIPAVAANDGAAQATMSTSPTTTPADAATTGSSDNNNNNNTSNNNHNRAKKRQRTTEEENDNDCLNSHYFRTFLRSAIVTAHNNGSTVDKLTSIFFEEISMIAQQSGDDNDAFRTVII